MSRTIPTVEPIRLTSGDSWEWDVKRLTGDYPASGGWDLVYYLTGPSKLKIEGEAPAGEDYWEVRVVPASTAKLTAGRYTLAGYVTDGTDRLPVYSGVLVVDADPATQTAAVPHAEKTLAIIEAAIEGRLTADIESYQIQGRAVNKIPMERLMKLRGYYASMVRRQRNPGELLRDVGVRFG